MSETDSQPVGVDTTTPSVARMYDYYLGGKDNYQVDREAAERTLSVFPVARPALVANRKFLSRVVRYMTEQGIRQFIDLGTGLPTQRNVHQVAQGQDPAARVAYVDNDPVVLAHARALLADMGDAGDKVRVVDADMRRPAQVLADPRLREVIDFGEPVGVLFIAVLHFVSDDDDPAGIVGGYRDALAPGSYLGMSLATSEGNDQETIDAVRDVYASATAQAYFRPNQQIAGFFDGLDVAEPGLVNVPDWRPDTTPTAQDRVGADWLLAGVGRKGRG